MRAWTTRVGAPTFVCTARFSAAYEANAVLTSSRTTRDLAAPPAPSSAEASGGENAMEERLYFTPSFATKRTSTVLVLVLVAVRCLVPPRLS